MSSEWSKLLDYNPETGHLFWKDRHGEKMKGGRTGRWTSQFTGKKAGHLASSGYVMVGIRQKLLCAHRVIWEMVHGPIPSGMKIDHINGNCSDNRICNLRLASHGQNRSNSRHSARSGLKGVYIERHKYRAQIRVNKKCISIGTYSTKGEAAVAYAKSSLMYQGRFSPFYRKFAQS